MPALVDFDGGFAGYVLSVEDYGSVGGLVNSGKKIENRGFSGTVGAYKAVKLAFFYLDIKIVHGAKTAEGNAQICCFKN